MMCILSLTYTAGNKLNKPRWLHTALTTTEQLHINYELVFQNIIINTSQYCCLATQLEIVHYLAHNLNDNTCTPWHLTTHHTQQYLVSKI